MKKPVKTFKEVEVSKINIKWSIHAVTKTTKKGKAEGCELKYMTVKKVGRRKETLLHETFSKALAEVGF